MKLFTIVAILSTLTVAVQCGFGHATEEEMAAFHATAMECKEESGATDADLESLMKMEPSASMEAKCMGACMMKKFKVMNSNGQFDKNVAMQMAEQHLKGDAEKLKIAEEIMDACKDIPISNNHCEAAEQYGHCMKEECNKRGISKEDF